MIKFIAFDYNTHTQTNTQLNTIATYTHVMARKKVDSKCAAVLQQLQERRRARVRAQMKIAIHTNKFATQRRPALGSFPCDDCTCICACVCNCLIVSCTCVCMCVCVLLDPLGAIHLLLLPFLVAALPALASPPRFEVCLLAVLLQLHERRRRVDFDRHRLFCVQNMMATLAKRWRKSSLPFFVSVERDFEMHGNGQRQSANVFG